MKITCIAGYETQPDDKRVPIGQAGALFAGLTYDGAENATLAYKLPRGIYAETIEVADVGGSEMKQVWQFFNYSFWFCFLCILFSSYALTLLLYSENLVSRFLDRFILSFT